MSCLNVFPKEKVIVNRERSANAYGVLEYFTSKFLAELPMNLLPAVLYACVVYFSANLRKSRFGIFVLVLMLETMTGISLGLAVSAVMPNLEAALGKHNFLCWISATPH
jgi:ABC-type multidrug transport system permease subunit